MKSLLLQNTNGARETLKEIGVTAVGTQLEILDLMKDLIGRSQSQAAGSENEV